MVKNAEDIEEIKGIIKSLETQGCPFGILQAIRRWLDEQTPKIDRQAGERNFV